MNLDEQLAEIFGRLGVVMEVSDAEEAMLDDNRLRRVAPERRSRVPIRRPLRPIHRRSPR